MDGQIRAFFALPLSPSLADRVGDWMKELRRTAPGVRWVAPDGLHITLRFLGELNFARVSELSARVQEVTQKEALGALQLQIGDAGVFPHLREPRTFWLGVEGDVARLQRLVAMIEDVVRLCGFEPEMRSFRPHVTLGRVKAPGESSVAAMQALGDNPMEGESWVADSYILMKSDLRPQGAFYTPLAEFKL